MHEAKGAESRLHSKVALGSLELKAKLGICAVTPSGPDVIVVSGNGYTSAATPIGLAPVMKVW
jgi:hypothetical protein